MIEKIENINKLAEALENNEFYAFHDAEIVSIWFEHKDSVTVTVVIQLHRNFENFEKDGKPFLRFKSFDAKFKFFGVYPFELKDFNHQNVISELLITKQNDKFNVHFVSCFGADFKFECEKIKFVDVKSSECEESKYIPELDKIKAAALAARDRKSDDK